MLRFTRSRAVKSLAAGAIAGVLVLGAGVSSAHATGTSHDAWALAQFRANLKVASEVAAFDRLSPNQRAELADYLLGESDPYRSLSAASARSTVPSAHAQHAGNFELRTETSTTISPKAQTRVAATASATRTVSSWQSFIFAGITISKTTVRVTYQVSGVSATSITSYSCIVDANYDPFSTVTSSKNSAWVSSGRATAECKVTVKRGTPTPWGQVTFSTRSNIQYVTGSGSGAVTAHGWR